MKSAAKNLEFERAALLRDRVIELRRALDDTPVAFSAATPSASNKDLVKSDLRKFYRASTIVPRKH
jgi:excinuclease UvrABC nuclease subunit